MSYLFVPDPAPPRLELPAEMFAVYCGEGGLRALFVNREAAQEWARGRATFCVGHAKEEKGTHSVHRVGVFNESGKDPEPVL